MTTIISFNHLKFKINENDHYPPHVHVEGLGGSVRINLETLEVMDFQTGYSKSVINKIIEIVKENRTYLINEWEIRHG